MSQADYPEHADDDEESSASSATRIKGVLFLIGGAAGTLVAMVLSAYLAKHGLFPRRGGAPALVLIFIPLGLALAGFTELLTGLNIRQVARKWDDLKGWERGILMALLAFSPFIFYSVGVELF
jgi:hypothetical protein